MTEPTNVRRLKPDLNPLLDPFLRNYKKDIKDQRLELNQEDFMSIFRRFGRAMISAPDLYEIGKSADEGVLKSLQEDFKWPKRVITSTNIHHKWDSPVATIVHHSENTIIYPSYKQVVVPPYSLSKLDTVLEDESVLLYLQALFDTEDSPDMIKEVLERLVGNKDELRVLTLNQSHRENSSRERLERVFSFMSKPSYKYHLIDSTEYVNELTGYSRGMSEDPERAAQENEIYIGSFLAGYYNGKNRGYQEGHSKGHKEGFREMQHLQVEMKVRGQTHPGFQIRP